MCVATLRSECSSPAKTLATAEAGIVADCVGGYELFQGTDVFNLEVVNEWPDHRGWLRTKTVVEVANRAKCRLAFSQA